MSSYKWGIAALLLAFAPLPASASLYDWTLDAGAGLTGWGTLTTGSADGGGFDIAAISGQIGGVPVSLLGGNPGVGATTSPSGAFLFDNVVYPSSDPVFDVNGLLFTISGDEGNIWGNGVAGSYSYYTHNGSGYDYTNGSVLFTLTAAPTDSVAAPEPASLVLLGSGLVGFALVRRRQG